PTQGRLSTRAMMPLSESFDCPGILARTSQDVADLWSVCSTDSEPIVELETLREIRIGIPKGPYWADADPQIASNGDAVRTHLTNLGAEILEVEVPDQSEWAELANI